MPGTRLVSRLALGTVVGAVVIGISACSAPATPASPAALPEGFSAELRQGRFDVEARQLVVHVDNGSDSAATVDRVAVSAPVFAEPLVYDGAVELSAGEAVDVRIDLPTPDCGTGDEPVAVDLRGTVDGVAFAGAVTPTDPFGSLDRIGDTDCLTASVDAVAAIALPDRLRTTGSGTSERAWIDVLLTPMSSGDASFVIDVVHSTTLLSAEDGPDWPLALEVVAGGDPITVPLAVRPARCDAHAIADDKRGTILPFEITTSDGYSGRIDRSSDDPLQADLYAYVRERCGLESASAVE